MELTSYSRQGASAPYTLSKTVRDFRNVASTFGLDILDREATNSFPAVGAVAARSALSTYTLFGQPDKVINGASGAMRTNFYAYDTMNRMARKDSPEGVLTYAYNEAGAVTNLSAYGRRLMSVNATPGGTADLSVAYGYDALNRLTSVTNGTAITRYTWDAIRNLSTMVYPNTVTNLWQYDQRSRLTNLLWKSGGTPLGSFAYQVNETSQRTNLTESINGTSLSHQWAYNALQRLTNQTVSAGPSGTLAYIYDLVGNRTNRTGSLGSLGTVTNGFNVTDWLAVDTYDNNGNTLTGANGSGVATTCVYDGENHLVSLTSGSVVNTLTYNADGNRATKLRSGVTTWWLWDDRNPTGYPQVVLEQNYIAGTSTNVSKVFTLGLRLISQKIGSITNYYGSDGLGSVRILFDGSGVVTDTYTYDAYGSLIQSSGTTVNNYRFAGEELDPDLGLIYLRARYENPASGRFWSADSYEGNRTSPRTMHKYGYCSGNPVSKVDPSGHDEVDIVLSTLDIFATIRAPLTRPSFIAGGVGGVDVTKALKRTLLDVEVKFNKWSRRQKMAAANQLRDLLGAAVSGGGGGAAGAWDIIPLMEVGFADTPMYDGGKAYGTGTGLWKRTVSFMGNCYYGGAVNYAIWGKMNQLCHDFLMLEGNPPFDDGLWENSYSLDSAQKTAQAWKHFRYGDFGEIADEALAFTTFGYNGTVPARRLPCNPSGETFPDKVLPWCWEPIKGRK